MGILSSFNAWLNKSTPEAAPAEPAETALAIELDAPKHYGHGWLAVVGESYRQDELRVFLSEHPERTALVMVRCEPENEHDPKAVVILTATEDARLGYLPRDVARDLNRRLAATGAVLCPAKIHGGTADKPSIGLTIDGAFLRRSFTR